MVMSILSYVASSCETEAVNEVFYISPVCFLQLIACVDIGNELLHEALGPFQLCKTILPVEAMRILRSQNPAAEALQFGMSHHDFQQPLAQSLATKRLQDEYISELRKGCVVRHQARKTDLLLIPIEAE